MSEEFAMLLVAVDMLGAQADERGTSLHIHHCPKGNWGIFFGEADRVVEWLGEGASFPAAVLASLQKARAASNIHAKEAE